MAASQADVSELLGPLIDRLASELGEPIAPDLLDGLIAQNLRPGGPPPEFGVPGSGQDLRGLLLNGVVAVVIQAYSPEIAEGRDALLRGLDNLNVHIAQMIAAGEQHLGGQYEPSEIRAAVQRAAAEMVRRERTSRKPSDRSC